MRKASLWFIMSKMAQEKLKIIGLIGGNDYDFIDVRCGTQQEFLAQLSDGEFDLGIISAEFDRPLGIDTFLRVVGHRAPLMPIILLGYPNDYLRRLVDLILPQKVEGDILRRQAENLVRRRRLLAQMGLVGRSEALYTIADTVLRVSPTELPVLITGESGTGKELVARSIHDHSRRREGPFVAINCGAIPETLLESQLFGYKKGAFTGAVKDTPGFFDQSKGGTLFLDEIGEVPQSVQVKLLRVLETGEYFPVGDVRPRRADSRIIAATNRDLRNMMAEGKFRQDLYYRLGGVQIFIPPLRERKEDIPILAFFFARQVAEQNGVKFAGFSDDAVAAMMQYHWPGNVRELKNLVSNVVLLSGGREITARDLEDYFSRHEQVGRQLPVLGGERTQDRLSEAILSLLQQNNQLLHRIIDLLTKPPSIEDAERLAIENALKVANGSRRDAAAILGISPRTLYRKMKKYGIK